MHYTKHTTAINTTEMLIVVFVALGKIKALQNRTCSTSFLNITYANQIPSHGPTVFLHYVDFLGLLTFSYRA